MHPARGVDELCGGAVATSGIVRRGRRARAIASPPFLLRAALRRLRRGNDAARRRRRGLHARAARDGEARKGRRTRRNLGLSDTVAFECVRVRCARSLCELCVLLVRTYYLHIVFARITIRRRCAYTLSTVHNDDKPVSVNNERCQGTSCVFVYVCVCVCVRNRARRDRGKSSASREKIETKDSAGGGERS